MTPSKNLHSMNCKVLKAFDIAALYGIMRQLINAVFKWCVKSEWFVSEAHIWFKHFRGKLQKCVSRVRKISTRPR